MHFLIYHLLTQLFGSFFICFHIPFILSINFTTNTYHNFCYFNDILFSRLEMNWTQRKWTATTNKQTSLKNRLYTYSKVFIYPWHMRGEVLKISPSNTGHSTEAVPLLREGLGLLLGVPRRWSGEGAWAIYARFNTSSFFLCVTFGRDVGALKNKFFI